MPTLAAKILLLFKKAVLANSVTYTTDLDLKGTNTKTHLSDILLRAGAVTQTQIHTADLILKAIQFKIHTIDLALASRTSKFHTTDMDLRGTLLKTHRTDIQIGTAIPSKFRPVTGWIDTNQWFEI